ncbi:DUF6512 family protein, partial [uncultured Clostridium sp.]|uniref:DUF6512 family protein n=1 Tax=uncultured Clostridium sp. TaxID=59620 RepID=UPI00272F33D4
IILGTILHFTYDWSNGNPFVASFSSVNESTWEHLKLAFFPMLIACIVEYFFVKDKVNNYIEAKTIGIVTSMLFITSFFFTYTGIIGTNFLIIDILTFILGVLIDEYVVLSIIILVILTIYFVLFTFITPKINYFRDPVTGGFGRDFIE